MVGHDRLFLSRQPVWQSLETDSSGLSQRSLYETPHGPVMRIRDVGYFCIGPNRIVADLENEAKAPAFLLGKVFGLWLELAKLPVLHGSCLEFGSSAIGFLGFSGTGKSTFAAAFREMGYLLLTDDLIPLPIEEDRPIIYPGIPFSRVWPDTGKLFYRSFEESEKVHPQFDKRKITNFQSEAPLFSETPRPLTVLFILERSEEINKPVIQRFTPSQSLVELVRMSYQPDLVQALNLQNERLANFARIVERVPVFGLKYPTGYDRLKDACLSAMKALPVKTDSAPASHR